MPFAVPIRRRLPVASLLAAAVCGVAPGASAVVSVKANNASGPYTFGRADCAANKAVIFTWDLGTSFSGQAVTVEATSAAPAAASACPAGTSGLKTYSPTGTSITVNVQDFLFGAAAGCNGPSTSASPGTAYFCVSFQTSTLTSSTFETGFIAVNYALQPPGAPTALAVTPGDQHLRLSWSPASSSDQIASYDIYAVLSGAAIAPDRPVQSVGNATSADVQQTSDGATLANGTAYDLAVRGNDTYGNTSAVSAPVTATPQQIDDFYRHYRALNGAARGGGGCSSGGEGGGLCLVALLAGLGASLRRRKGRALPLLAAAACLPWGARAQSRFAVERAPRRVFVGLKLDRYDPQVDSERGLTGTPYHDVFHGRAPGRFQLEVDWEPLHPLGSVLVGGTVGFWQNIGRGIVTASGAQSGDTALLDIVPLGLVATYRFDVLADRFRLFPLVPYAQAGLSAALWSAFAGNGKVPQASQGGRGSGWTTGYTAALGVALALDAIDPDISNEAYVGLGLQRTCLFAEYGWTRLDGFHRSGVLVLSDRAWRFGLSLEF